MRTGRSEEAPQRTERRRAEGNVARDDRPREAAAAATARRAARPPYRCVPYIFIAPEKRGAIGGWRPRCSAPATAAARGCARRTSRFLNRLLGGESPTHGELLSYLFFDPEFIEELIAMGRNDARRWLDMAPGPEDPWQIEPLEAFTRR